MKFSLLFKGACLLILAVDTHACFLFFHREFTSLSYNLFLITHTGYNIFFSLIVSQVLLKMKLIKRSLALHQNYLADHCQRLKVKNS